MEPVERVCLQCGGGLGKHARKYCSRACANRARAQDTIEEILDRILSKSRVVEDTGCWEYLGATTPKGYGHGRFRGKDQYVHRLVYELVVEPIPDGLEPDHTCRNPRCFHPDHLELVTHLENMLRGDTSVAKGAQATHCSKGHLLDEANTYRYPNGGRRCRTCHREQQRIYKQTHRLKPGQKLTTGASA